MSGRTIPQLPANPQGKKRKATKLLWLLFILFIVLLGVLFFRSPLSKISNIHWIGHHFVTQADLIRTSGLQLGAPFFGTSGSTIAKRIQAAYPFIKSVEVRKQFPGVIQIFIHEYRVVAYEWTAAGMMQACLENGKVITLGQPFHAVPEKPLLRQWDGQQAMKSKLMKELVHIPEALLTDISEILFYPSSSYPDRIKFYTRSGFEVITSVTFLQHKILYISGVVETQAPGRITMLEADSYIPYSSLPAVEEAVPTDGEGAPHVNRDSDGKETDDTVTERHTGHP